MMTRALLCTSATKQRVRQDAGEIEAGDSKPGASAAPDMVTSPVLVRAGEPVFFLSFSCTTTATDAHEQTTRLTSEARLGSVQPVSRQRCRHLRHRCLYLPSATATETATTRARRMKEAQYLHLCALGTINGLHLASMVAGWQQ